MNKYIMEQYYNNNIGFWEAVRQTAKSIEKERKHGEVDKGAADKEKS